MSLLEGARVIDASTLFAGPLVATLMGDHGADVVKVEHPRGDDARRWGKSKDQVPLWWKVSSRNKRCIAIDLHEPEGQEILRTLARQADVLVENFRPGRLEAWGLGWDDLHRLNPRLVMVRVTGFGQSGPYRNLAGFGTLAEAMSGFAQITGRPESEPTLPPFGLADGIAGITGAFAATAALLKRERTGEGELVDVALYEPLMWILGAQIVEYDQLGTVQQRTGNQSPRTCPRNTYRTRDGKWIALSASAESIAHRVFTAIGHPEMSDDPRFRTNADRLAHRDEVDRIVSEWAASVTQDEAIEVLRRADAAVAPIYDVSQVYTDPHFRARGSVLAVDDPDLGSLTMQGIFPAILSHPGTIRWTAPVPVGYHTDEVLREAGYAPDTISHLRARKVIV